MNPILAGMLVALTMTVSVGPGLVMYFQATVNRGFAAGLSVLSGLWISDFGFITISLLGISRLLNTVHNQHIAAIACSTALVVFGLTQWIKKPAALAGSGPHRGLGQKTSLATGFLSGFMINSSNPFVFVFWMTLVSLAGVNFGVRTQSFYAFFIGLIACGLIFDISKCFIFSKITVYFNPIVLTRINRIAGSVVMAGAIAIICKSFVF